MDNFSIYVHVPWCRRRCPYCDFYIVVGKPEHDFIDAILQEWTFKAAEYGEDRQALSLYFGGGTPSLLKVDQLKRLIDFFDERGVLLSEREITLEANPEDLDESYIKSLRSSGVNRISLGIQSLDDAVLKTLGRKHSRARAREVIASLLEFGFKNISVDLIIGVPGQACDQIIDDLQFLQLNGIVHISTYLLTIEEGTHFDRRIREGKIAAPVDDEQAAAYEAVQRCLLSMGYEQYEISSFAMQGYYSVHNQGYWGTRDYLGLGPGAHSRRKKALGLSRMHNRAPLREWLRAPQDPKYWQHEYLSAEEAFKESLAFGLRNMALGINIRDLATYYSVSLPENLGPIWAKFQEQGWLIYEDDRYKISQKGALFADAIMRELIGGY